MSDSSVVTYDCSVISNLQRAEMQNYVTRCGQTATQSSCKDYAVELYCKPVFRHEASEKTNHSGHEDGSLTQTPQTPETSDANTEIERPHAPGLRYWQAEVE